MGRLLFSRREKKNTGWCYTVRFNHDNRNRGVKAETTQRRSHIVLELLQRALSVWRMLARRGECTVFAENNIWSSGDGSDASAVYLLYLFVNTTIKIYKNILSCGVHLINISGRGEGVHHALGICWVNVQALFSPIITLLKNEHKLGCGFNSIKSYYHKKIFFKSHMVVIFFHLFDSWKC